MKKKRSSKKAAEVDIREACQSIVNDLYAEVERVNGLRIDGLQARLDALKAAHDATISQCGVINERLLVAEERLAKMLRCDRPEPTTFIGRLHRRKWFCLPWCR